MPSDNVNENWRVSERALPLPQLPWIMRQTWNHSLFIHYPIHMDTLRQLVPDTFPLDSYNGWGWIGLVVFDMEQVKLRNFPIFSAFPELNIRTYVMINGKPGVYFFSLDATNLPVVIGSRLFNHIPYYHASIERQQERNSFSFRICRKQHPSIMLDCTYATTSNASYVAEKGSFDEWLLERYCFYTTTRKGHVVRCDIAHHPWHLQQVKAEICENTVLSGQGIHVESVPPVLHYGQRVDVRIWPLVRV